MYGKKWKPIACKRKINILWQVNNIMQMETDVIIKLIYNHCLCSDVVLDSLTTYNG